MAENLVIVESPAKAKTIEKFLGASFTVKSSFGHVRDLSKKELGINIEKGFIPNYEISADKKKVVAELKKLVKESKVVWLASDEDREGEAIAWHLYEVLQLKGLNTKRIVFHEITKDAIVKAIENPREIDTNLVDAQQARRILDRLVGFELSPVLWKKVKPSLSAGRVQSVSVRIIVEREREIIGFTPESYFKTTADFTITIKDKTYTIVAELNKRFSKEDEVVNFLNLCKNSSFKVDSIEKKPGKRSPAAPFTTSTLQQEASRKLGFPVAKTMLIAQKLYEEGHITYMRTDSVNLSDLAIATTKEMITSQFGSEYSKVRKFDTKTKGAQEAHEAIRPTYVKNEVVSSNSDEQRLYDLIRKRTIASQMADAIFDRTVISIDVPKTNLQFQAKAEVVVFDGFLKVYSESTDDDATEDDVVVIPPVTLHSELNLDKIQAQQKFTQHLPRYTEASLVRKLEELGIGRPSTYAPTISTIQKRGYVDKNEKSGETRQIKVLVLKNQTIKEAVKSENYGAEKGKLIPTDIGMVVNDFLVKHFNEILDYNFTANVEKEFDTIALGKMDWQKMIKSFYTPFHKNVDNTLENSERGDGIRVLGLDPESGKQVTARIGRFGPMVQLGTNEDEDKPVFASLSKGMLLETITFEEALSILNSGNDGKFIGIDPTSGKNVYAKVGRFGPFVQLGETTDEDKKYISLTKGLTVDNVTLDQALVLLSLPRDLGMFDGKKVSANIGRFGPYIAYNGAFVSLKKNDPDVYAITLEQALYLIQAKKESDLKREVKSFPEDSKLKIILDRWGNPSVFYKKKYFRIAKGVKPENLTLQECYKIAGVK